MYLTYKMNRRLLSQVRVPVQTPIDYAWPVPLEEINPYSQVNSGHTNYFNGRHSNLSGY